MSDTIKVELLDDPDTKLQAYNKIGTRNISINDVETQPLYKDWFWLTFYGSPGTSGKNADKMKKGILPGSTFKGRILVNVDITEKDKVITGKKNFTDKKMKSLPKLLQKKYEAIIDIHLCTNMP